MHDLQEISFYWNFSAAVVCPLQYSLLWTMAKTQIVLDSKNHIIYSILWACILITLSLVYCYNELFNLNNYWCMKPCDQPIPLPTKSCSHAQCTSNKSLADRYWLCRQSFLSGLPLFMHSGFTRNYCLPLRMQTVCYFSTDSNEVSARLPPTLHAAGHASTAK